MHISELVFRKKNIFYFLIVALFIAGLYSYRYISKLEDPEIVVMIAKVVTVYPGASAHEVEMQVTSVLEDAISELADIESIKSQSTANVSMIDVELKMTVPQEEIEQRWEFLRRKLKNATPKLPKGAQEPMVIDDIGDVYGMFYAMTSDGYSLSEMSDYAQYIKRNLLQVEGVRKVAIYGEQNEVVEIVLSQEKMAQMGILPLQLITTINDYNSSLYAGMLTTGDEQLRVKVSGKANSITDLENIVITGFNQDIFKLSDFAEIVRTYPDPMKNTLHLNNKQAIGISISMESGYNIIDLGERVDKCMSELHAQMPAGYDFEKIFFQPDIVRDAINDFMINLIMSVATVVLILMITMGLRSGLIIGGGLALTVVATFPFLYVTDGTLQRISLGAFIVAMGMLVDNAIVVIDGILVRMQQQGRRSKSTFTIPAKRTAWPLLGATLIAVFAFLPAVLSKDTAGTYVHDLFVVLCISLLLSWVFALTQVPLFSAIFLKIPEKKQNTDPFNTPLYKWLRKTVTFFLHHKFATLTISLLLFLVAIYNIKNVKKTFFPDFNYSQAYIEYKLPYGTTASRMHKDLHEITEHFLKYDEVVLITTSQGMTPTRYCLVRPIGDVADNYGEVLVNFEDYETLNRMKPIFEEYLRNNYPDANIRFRKYNLSVKASHTVEAEFSGPDPVVLRQLSSQAMEIMHQSPYIDKSTIGVDWEPMGKSLVAQYKMDAARRNSTSRQDLALALLTATEGVPLGTIYEGERPIAVKLRMTDKDGSSIEKLDDIPVWNMIPNVNSVDKNTLAGLMIGIKSLEDIKNEIIRSVPLSSVTSGIDVEKEEQIVRRVDGKRTIQAQCEPKSEYNPAVARNDIREQIESIELPEGYSLRWMGEHELQHTAVYNIFRFFPVTIILIVLILVILFNDFKRPIIILLCIPMAMIGVISGLLLTGQPYTFVAIIGTIGLIGMLVKNAIVLLDEIERQLKEGNQPRNAIVNATILRTRPVIMASATTVLGMLPLLTDPMYGSLAVAVIGGLIVGTLITLVFVPILYAIFYRVKT
jgi:multidrug efflux pump subunit AcrB